MSRSGFPQPNPTLPFWRTEPHPLDEHRSTEALPAECDVLIIGAGYAGASTAYHLTNENHSPPSIVILEARQACSGATGRNGGHLRPSAGSPEIIQKYGIEAALEVAAFEFQHLNAIKTLVEKEHIDCELAFTTAHHVFLQEETLKAIGPMIETLRDSRPEFVDNWEWTDDPAAAERISGFKGAKGCFRLKAGRLWPYKLTTHLLDLVVAKGVNLQTMTPVTSVSEAPDPHGFWCVETPQGSIRAKKMVFATNGYTSALLPEYADVIYPFRAMCSHIKTPEDKPAPRLAGSVSIYIEGNRDYLIQRPDGSLIVGGADSTFLEDQSQSKNNVDDSTLIEPAKPYFDNYMQRNFIGWENSEAYVSQIWTGIQGHTVDDLPHMGAVPNKPGQFIIAGLNGHGMSVIFLGAEGVAQMILFDKSYEETDLPRIFKTTVERLA